MGPLKDKKYIGILFECCNVYRRIYINKDGNATRVVAPSATLKLRLRLGRRVPINAYLKPVDHF